MPIFQDPFLDNDQQWEIRDDAYALLRIATGDYAYIFEHRRDQDSWTTWQPLDIPDDITYKIHTVIERVSGPNNGYGLIWRCQDEDNCFSFEISRSGHFRVRQRVTGIWFTRLDWTASPHIRQGEKALNELLLIQLPDKVRLLVNEKVVYEMELAEPPLGHGIGFIVNGRIRIRIHSVIVLRHIEPPTSNGEYLHINEQALRIVLKDLNALVGLANIKQEVQTFINFLKVQKWREERGLAQPKLSLHMVLAGPPGTGKTTVARLIGRIYQALGLLSQGHVVETDRAGLVAPYVGHTALKVQEMVEKALGGILFIDEAYALMPKGDRANQDFGLEAIEALLKRMEDQRGRMAVIIAGYADEMDRFLNANPGVRSRFNRYFYFNHYKPDELTTIFQRMAEDNGLRLTPAAAYKLRTHFDQIGREQAHSFGNGRYARNLLEKTMERQANRIVDLSPMTDDLLITLSETDVPEINEYLIH